MALQAYLMAALLFLPLTPLTLPLGLTLALLLFLTQGLLLALLRTLFGASLPLFLRLSN